MPLTRSAWGVFLSSATKWRPKCAATKWRYDVAMGVSLWNTNHHRGISPEGTIGNPTHRTHVAPSGLRDRFDLPIHGFTPVATSCRPFGTSVLTSGRTRSAKSRHDPATKWRYDVAMGVSLWNTNHHRGISPRRDDRKSDASNSCRPFGASRSFRSTNPTICRPFGTNMLPLRPRREVST